MSDDHESPTGEDDSEPDSEEPTVSPEGEGDGFDGDPENAYEFSEDEFETLSALGITAEELGIDAEIQATEWTFPDTRQTGESATYGSGVAVWDDLPLANYSIDVDHPDYDPGSIASLTLDSSGRQPLVPLTRSARQQYDVSITVEDSDGTPLRDVSVRLGDATGRTGSGGQYTVSVPEGTYALRLSKSGYIDETDDVTVDGPTQLAYTLERTAREGYIYDPTDPPFRRFATAYYPFDVDSGLADIVGRFEGITGTTANGVNENGDGLLGTPGLDLGTREQNRYLSIPDVPLHDPAAPFTVCCWAYITGTGSWQVIASIEDPDENEHVAFGLDTDGTLRGFSQNQTRSVRSETEVPLSTWVLLSFVWDGYKLRGYVGGTEAFAVAPDSDPREWLSGASRVTVGTRRLATSSPVGGSVDELAFFDTALSTRQIDAVRALAETGEAPGVADPGRTSASVDLVSNVDLPARTTLQIRVSEDVGNTGTINNTDTATIRDGIRRNALDALQGGQGNRYVPRILGGPERLGADESEIADFAAEFSPYINDIAIETEGTTDRIYTVYFRSITGGAVYAIPVYPPERVESDWLRLRPSSGDPVGAVRLTDPTGNPLRARHPRTGEVVGIDFELVAESGFDVDPNETYPIGLDETVTAWSPFENAGSVENAGELRLQSNPEEPDVEWSPYYIDGETDISGKLDIQARADSEGESS